MTRTATPPAEMDAAELFDLWVEGGDGLRIVSTTRAFDPAPGTSHSRNGARLLDLFATAGVDRVVQAHQVHGVAIADSDTLGSSGSTVLATPADGLVTRRAGTMLVVRTADCVPLVLHAPGTSLLAALHSGWRGTLGGILDRALEWFASEGIRPEALALWIGPRICGDCYEVSDDLAAEFARHFAPLGGFVRGRHLDLGELIRLRAIELGVPEAAIRTHPACTYEAKDRFPSHRRDGSNRGLVHTAAWMPARSQAG